MTLDVAFKEWTGICDALIGGRQALILRKGGIAEEGGVFRPEHPRFWLYPTYFHEAPDAPKPGTIPLRAYCEVAAVHWAERLEQVLNLAGLHEWDEAMVRQRFAYRRTGLFVLTVRVFVLPGAVEIADEPEYAGCKTWVPLREVVSVEGAKPVISEETFATVKREIERRVA